MADGAHVQFGVEGAEEPFDVGEVFVAQHDLIALKCLVGQAGAQHVDAVEGGLGGDGVLVAGEAERLVGDVQVKVLGHLELVAHLAHPQRDLVLPA